MNSRRFLKFSGTENERFIAAATKITRRRMMQEAAVLGGGLLVSGTSLLSGGCTDKRGDDPDETAATRADGGTLGYRGINYDVGTNDGPNIPSSRPWHIESMHRDIRAIRHDLHCNSIGIHGTDIGRLAECSTAALENGLHVWLQPRLFESTQDQVLDYVSKAAKVAEELRSEYTAVTFNVGCEMSLFTSGFMPGNSVLERIANFPSMTVDQWTALQKGLRSHLSEVCAVARANFNGPLTYGSGPWEEVDWHEFDFVGLDYYMDSENEATYVEDLRKYRRFGKPIVILEFGCCTFEGADKAGGMGWEAVDYTKPVPEVKDGIVRSEQVQADYIGKLLDIFMAERVEGAFVYQFVSPELLHTVDPRFDLDMASYGVVKVVANEGSAGGYAWQPKLAFHELARRFGNIRGGR